MADPEAVMADHLATLAAMLEGTGYTAEAVSQGYGYGVITSAGKGDPFTVGEIIPMNGEYEREIGGDERRPSKWDVTCEWFGMDYAAASRRAASFK